MARPIYVDRCADNLVDKTAREINDYDDTGAKLCGWEKHKGPACIKTP